MFKDVAQTLEEIQSPRTRAVVCTSCLPGGQKWDMAAAVARHLVKADRKSESMDQLAYAVRRSEHIEQAEAILVNGCVHRKSAFDCY